MEKPSVAFDPLLNSLPLQVKRALAAHPPSCHPRRVFGRRENEKENERKRETGASWRSFPKPIFIIKWKSSFQSLGWVDLYPTSLQITKKNYKSNTITRTIWEEIKKGEQKGQTGSRKERAG